MAKIEYDINSLRPYTAMKVGNLDALDHLNKTVYTNYEETNPKIGANLNETKVGLDLRDSRPGVEFEGKAVLRASEGKRNKYEHLGGEEESGAKEEKSEHICLNTEELYEFRTNQCKLYLKNACPNSNRCKNSHSETWPRRNPLVFKYDYKLCPNIQFFRLDNKMQLYGKCNFGRKCKFSHSKEEQLYHPNLYKTRFCLNYPNCKGYYCPFAHSKSELRVVNNSYGYGYSNNNSGNYNGNNNNNNYNSYYNGNGSKPKFGKFTRADNDVSSTNTESTYGANDTIAFEEEFSNFNNTYSSNFTSCYNGNNSYNCYNGISTNNNNSYNNNNNSYNGNNNYNNNNNEDGLNETCHEIFKGVEHEPQQLEHQECNLNETIEIKKEQLEKEGEDNWFESLIRNGLDLLEDCGSVYSAELVAMDRVGPKGLNVCKWDELINIGNVNDLLSNGGPNVGEELKGLSGKLSKVEEEEGKDGNNKLRLMNEKLDEEEDLSSKYIKDEMFSTHIVEKVCPLCFKKEREMVLGSFEVDSMVRKSEEMFKLWD